MAEAHPLNVPGPFYVEKGCCIACGVPESIAPEIFDWAPDEAHCFVACQPQTAREVDRTLEALFSGEVDCIRYRGRDPRLLRRIAEFGSAECCDEPVAKVPLVLRDTVTFQSGHIGDTPESLAERLRAHIRSKSDEWLHYDIRPPRIWNKHVAIFSWEISGFLRRRYRKVAFYRLPEVGHFTAKVHMGLAGIGWSFTQLVHDWLTDSECADAIEWRASHGPNPSPLHAPI
ncbi:MAG TPA: ferredoxin [Allosphingosinicella sp.]